MATYAVGDVQGCYDQLCSLLEAINWSPESDHLWFAGDMVNRGNQSLEVIQLIRSIGTGATCVLGNHDLHLLATIAGARPVGETDTFQDVLETNDVEDIESWLRSLPLIHYDRFRGYSMVHAGIFPSWSIEDAIRLSNEVSNALKSYDYKNTLRQMYGDSPLLLSRGLSEQARLRYLINTFTRMRYCRSNGELEMQTSVAPDKAPPDLYPWYELRRNNDFPIIFGHWATLKLSRRSQIKYNVFHIDHGCVWGGKLTALRLEDCTFFSVPGLPAS